MSVPPVEDGAPAISLTEREERRNERRMNRPKIVPERRRHRRVPVSVFGRFMREDKQEYPCQVVNMSAGGMAVIAPVACAAGERVVAYLDNLGRIEGIVVRSFEGGFAVHILASLYLQAGTHRQPFDLAHQSEEPRPRRGAQARAYRAADQRLEADHAEWRRAQLPGDRRFPERRLGRLHR